MVVNMFEVMLYILFLVLFEIKYFFVCFFLVIYIGFCGKLLFCEFMKVLLKYFLCKFFVWIVIFNRDGLSFFEVREM